MPIPDEFIPPAILPGYEDWWEAFFELSTDRINGVGIGPIPAASIARHVTGWPLNEARVFRRVIRAMDRVYMTHDEGEEPESDNPARDAFRSGMRAKR
jgi:hypothetical protein